MATPMTATMVRRRTAGALGGQDGTGTLYTHVQSPIGTLMLLGREDALTGVYMQTPLTPRPGAGWQTAAEVFGTATDQLDEYFAGERLTFDLHLDPAGTPFQLRAWAALCEIPYGETRSYGEQAASMGRPNAARAVGAANRCNPLAIVVPCHRVIGHDGDLTGFGGGLDRKRFLLRHESDALAAQPAR
jgi:methylated-DNA-[protein]-cysteine S-methyltransferase